MKPFPGPEIYFPVWSESKNDWIDAYPDEEEHGQ